MSAYLNRAVSMVAGNNGMAASSSSSFDTNSISENRSFANDKSPLQIFVKAKKRINDIYDEINEYVVETFHFIDELPSNIDIVDKSEKELFESYIFKVAAIREVLHRDHMKVAFFGRTSNGKSSVINAMLKDKILPSGIGHTTNCFCQVEGVDGEDAYLVKEGSDEKLNVVNIKQLANALCQEKLSESSLVKIFWPRERCHLLRDDVVFVDSPGVDVSANLDDWIDNHCLDADVFVLVLNAESTMTLAEKSFFHTVSKKLSKPNVFVLNNRWDAAADEIEFQESVRSQHLERCLDFLSKELKVCSEKEAAERVFFVSAKETLNARIYESKGQPANLGAITDGFQTRYFEFLDFERKFEECISKSAVKTKFEQHSSRGRNIGNDMHLMLDNIYDRSNIMKKEKGDCKKKLTDRIQSTESNLMQITREMKQKIHNMVEEVEKKVSTALNEEIWRLGVLVDEFSMPFHSEPLVLNIYKKELNAHVEAGLGSNLRARLSMALSTNIESAQCEMTDRMHSLISSETIITQNKQIMTRSQPFELLYSLNCQNLCSDFQENLDFKFSWGITSMINRFTGKMKTNGKKSLTVIHRQGNAIERVSSVQSILENPNIQPPRIADGITPEQISTISRIVLGSIGSQGTVGGLVVAGILFKTIGWRILFGVGALYGCVYIYERLSWTTASKERAFKSQYVDHATKKLKMIVDLTSANCSHQVQQELSSTFARLCRVVDTATTDMNKELKEIEYSLANIETNQKSIKLLRNKASYILNELDIFENNYIKSN